MKKWFFILVFITFQILGFSQFIPNTTGTSNYFISGPSTIMDPGGNGNYPNNSSVIIHLYSDVSGQKVKLDFSSFNLSSGDYLYIYDGPSENYPLVFQFQTTIVPTEIYSTHISGSLTLKFTSTSSGTSTGFSADISLVNSYPPADLEPFIYAISNPAPQGGTLTMTGYTKNYGTGPALSDITSFYVSTDTILDFSDPLVAINDNLYALQPDRQRSYVFINLPLSLLPGSYYLFASADNSNNVTETDESNNEYYRPFQIIDASPDINFGNINTQPINLPYGNSVGATFTVYNSGNTVSGEFKVECLLSEDTIRDAGDLIYYSNTFSINANSNSGVLTPSCYFSDTISPGTYYLLFEADVNDSVQETIETNNYKYRVLNISMPTTDFGFQNMICPTSFVAGSPLLVNTRVTQQGNSNSLSSSLGLYISSDSIFSNDDMFLNSTYLNPINSGSFAQLNNYSFETFYNSPAGNYFLIFYADNTNNNIELNETNNFYACPVQIISPFIDISIDSVYFDTDTLHTEKSEILHLKTTTTGNYNGSCLVRIYQSEDSVLQNSGTLICSYNGTFNSGATTVNNITINTSPNDLEKYFHIQINPLLTLQESDFANNDTSFFYPFEIKKHDLAITQFSVAEDTIYQNGIFNFNYTIYNSGTEPVTNSTYYMLFSDDPIYDIGGDDVLSNNFYGALNPGASLVINYYDLLNETGITGWHYILLGQEDFSDDFSLQNNIAYDSIYFINQLEFNYFISQLNVITPLYAENSTIQAQVTAGSDGNSTLTSGDVRYYLSTDSVYSMSDIILNSYSFNFGMPGALSTVTQNVVLPAGYSGNYYLIARINYNNVFTETTTTDNFKSFPLSILPVDYDLDPANLNLGSSSVFQGGTSSLALTVYNNGLSTISTSYLHYFLSTDATWDSGDVLLDSISVPAISGYDFESISDFITIPSSTPPGSYYVIAYTDYRNNFSETDELNNTMYDNINVILIQNDLLFTTYNLSDNLMISANTFTLYTTIKNNGPAIATNSNVDLFISTDSIYDAGDISLGNVSGGALSSGSTSPRNISFIVPGLSSGNYYLIARADPANLQTESDENNNLMIIPVNLENREVDLDILTFNIPDSLINNNNGVTVSVPVYLDGNSSLTNFYVKAYLSSDTLTDGSDLLIGSTNQSSASLFAVTPVSVTVNIPVSVISGSYYLIFSSDDTQIYSETNETNNQFFESVFIKNTIKDVRPVQINYPDTIIPNHNYTPVFCSFKNEGNSLLSSVGYSLRISTDTIFDVSDFQIVSSSVSNINPGFTVNSSNTNLSLGSVPTFGNYYYILNADNNNSINEADELNNEIWKPVVIDTARYDLVATGYGIFSSGAFIYDRTTYSFYGGFLNNSNRSVNPVNVTLYISSDTIFDGTDIFVGGINSTATYGIMQNATVSISVNFSSIPDTIQNCYLISYVDPANAYIESNEDNNIRWHPITFSQNSAQLGWHQPFTTAIFDSPIAVTKGVFTPLTETLINHGEATSVSCPVNYYLSNDIFLDISDTLIHQQTLSSLVPGANSNFSANIYMPSYLTTGSFYYLIAEIDPDSLNQSDIRNDNLTIIPIVIVAPDQDLYISSMDAWQYDVFNRMCSYTANNSGSITVPSAQFTFYVSTDSIYNASDYLVENNILTNFNPGYDNEYFVFTNFGFDTLAGNYYMIGITDISENISETFEENNSVFKLFNSYTNSSFAMPVNSTLSFTDICGPYTIYDDGGKYGNYRSLNNSILTINTGNNDYKYEVTADSVDFDGCCDTLFIYDGNSSFSPVLGYFINSSGTPVTYTSSGTYLTFRFSSNGSIQNSGFKLSVNCIYAPEKPDLEIQICNVSSDTLYEGVSYQFLYEISNTGYVSSPACSSRVEIYSSTGQGTNIILGTSSIPALNPGETYPVNENYTIPVTLSGVYDKVYYLADYLNEADEIYEWNNFCENNISVDTISNAIIENNLPDYQINIEPNPNNGYFIISSSRFIYSLEILDNQSRIIYRKNNILTKRQEIQIEKTGAYFIKVTDENGSVIIKKLLVTR